MSVRVMTRVWDADFPTLAMKMIALKLADCANDDGENIYPSVGRVERDTGASSSVVREALSDMEAAGLLRVIQDGFGNKRGRSTTVRAFDIDRLKNLGDGWLVWAQVDVPVKDQKTGQPKRCDDGGVKTRKAWRLKAATPPAGGGVEDDAPLRLADPSPPAGGGVPLRLADPTPPAGGPPIEEPSIEPSTHTSKGVRVRELSLIDELREEGEHLHVVEHMLARLYGALRFDARDEPGALLRAIRDQLSDLPDGALREAADVLLRERTNWPSASVAYKAAQACQAKHMVRIEPGTTAWAAWSAHWHRIGHKYLARTYEQQGWALVPRQFPTVDRGAAE